MIDNGPLVRVTASRRGTGPRQASVSVGVYSVSCEICGLGMQHGNVRK